MLTILGACAVWSGVFAAIGFGALIFCIVQQSTFGLMGMRLTQRLRLLLLQAALRQVRPSLGICLLWVWASRTSGCLFYVMLDDRLPFLEHQNDLSDNSF